MRRGAFSLIEILVVLTVVTVLMALTVPALRRVRAQGDTLTCQSRQRDLLLRFLQYDTDYGTLPFGMNSDPIQNPPGGVAGNDLDPFAWWWFHYLGYRTPDAYNSQYPLVCPAKRLKSEILQKNVLWANYGVNSSLCRSPLSTSRLKSVRAMHPYAVQSIRSPGSTGLLLDSGYTVVNWYYATLNPPQQIFITMRPWTSYVPGLSINREPDRHLLDVQRDDAVQGRHPARTINTGYVDGHVQQIAAEASRVTREGDSYRGIKPFWDPLQH
jgi:prepilin-type N-terminal cleavage/methylation domain-containing protein/prepilin-type processing-associated H-X9-DG protein